MTAVLVSCMIAKVMEMERIVEQAFLYDFYGELLTEHQQQVYEDFVLNDLSLSEIAAERGVSRQGVHDLVKRCDKILEEYESKLHLVKKFLDTKQKVSRIYELVRETKTDGDDITVTAGKDEGRTGCEAQCFRQIEEIARDILENL